MKTTIRFTLDLTYQSDANIEAAQIAATLQQRLADSLQSNDVLTSGLPAKLARIEANCYEVPEAVPEDDMAAFMLQRIESSDLRLEDLPMRLARYGIMEPAEFTAEMRERMQLN